MDTPRASQAPTDPDRELLEELVAECLERLPVEGRAALDDIVARHPRLEGEIRAAVEFGSDIGLVETEGAGESAMPDRLGEFRLVERIGGGGMGVVYRAEQADLDRHVAIKMIRPELSFLPAARERFRRELLAVSQLQHPGIVPVLTAGETRGIPWIAMELVSGRPLSDLIEDDAAARGADWEERCLRYVRQAAEALEHAHARGVAHRDVKPSNIMITGTDRAQLLDFGLARQDSATRMTQSGAAPGSLPYMPPERLRDDADIDEARADIYSLGVTLHEALAGRLPYDAPGPEGTRALILDGRMPSLRAANPRVTWETETICAVAMDPDPARRYASAGDMARDVGCVLAGRPIEARRASWWLRTRRNVRRRPARAAAFALAFALFVIAPSVFAWRQVKDNERIEAERTKAEDERTRAVRAAEVSLETVILMVDVLETTDSWTWAHRIRDPDALEARIRKLMSELDDDDLDTAPLCRKLGQAALFIGNSELARELARRDLDLRRKRGDDMEVAEALVQLAICHDGAAEVEPATRYLEEADELVADLPLHHPARLAIAKRWLHLYTHREAPEEAAALADEVIRVSDGQNSLAAISAFVEALKMRGHARMLRGDLVGAEADLRRSVETRRAVDHHPLTIVETVALHAHVLARLKRNDDALATLTAAIDDITGMVDPRHPGIRRMRHLQGTTLFRLGKRAEARPWLLDALRAAKDGEPPSPLLIEAAYSLGHVLYGEKDWTGAADAHAEAVRMSRVAPHATTSDRALNLFGQGRALNKLDKSGLAVPLLQEAVELQPDWRSPRSYVGALVHYELGVALDKLARHREAGEALWLASQGFAANPRSRSSAFSAAVRASYAYKRARNFGRAARAAKWALDLADKHGLEAPATTLEALEDIVEEGDPDG